MVAAGAARPIPARRAVQREVDPEDHRPVEILREEAAKGGTERTRAREDDDKICVIFGSVLVLDVAKDRHRNNDQAAAAKALDGASEDEDEEARRER